MGMDDVPIRTLVRTGDTPQTARAGMRRRPPHILVTTPESLYVLLGSESGRAMLSTTRSVIVDEIHAIAGNKRGSHLALSLARLDALTDKPPVRIGLSATQKPIDEIAQFLVRTGAACEIVDVGHVRERDLAIELPSSPLEAVMSHDVWAEVYERIADLAASHRTTLVFVNTRRMAERAARHLTELLGPDQVMSHHGSMSKELRHKAEQRLKNGELKVLCATASLELGIDIGDVDLVCQLGSPRSIATFLQRAGRASHQVGGTPKARIFPLSRDELVECAALLDAVRRGELDRLHIPPKPLDVLSQQIVAEVGAREWNEDALFELVRRAYPYRDLRAQRIHRDRAHVVRWLRHEPRTSLGLRSPRCGQRRAARPQGRAPDRADFGRRNSRQCGLRRRARAGGPEGRHGQRGLRGRKPRGRHVPARQYVVQDSPRRSRTRARRGCARTGAHDTVLARRSARTHERALARRIAPSRGGRRPHRRSLAVGGGRARGRVAAHGLPHERQGRARRPPHAIHDRARALFRRERRDAARHPFALREPHQPRVGVRAAQALLPQVQLRAAGRGHRGRDRAFAVHDAQLRSRRRGALPSLRTRCATCSCRRCSRRRCSQRVGGGSRTSRLRSRASAAAGRSRHPCSACAPTTSWRRCSPTRSRAPTTSSAIARFPTTRSCAR